MTFRATLDLLLLDWLQADALTARPRFAEHSADTFAAVLDLSERLAQDKFAPHNRRADTEEPHFDGERVHLPEATREAVQAHAEAGLRAAGQDAECGGMQLPYVVEAASRSFFMKASIGIDAYAMLTTANANLLMAHGTPAQRTAFAVPELDGRYTGTMCLSEPQAGSSLGDILTRAVPDGAGSDADPLGPRYRLQGHKMWISGGEHELSDNIVHLVLAKVPGADGRLPPGVKGISLFIVPRWLVDADGRLTGTRNDVALAGLNHKLGYRGTVNTLLNFGEGRYPVAGRAGAVGYRVGAEGDGLRCMFHMMNEARIQVGLGATMLGWAGYEAALDYARQRPQGRPAGPAGRDPATPPRPIIEHPDVRRMLLAQKAYAEGGLALGLYCARLVDDKATGDAAVASEAGALLELLTPVAKSWPSEWCQEANSLAIQVHGGYGYTRDFAVEQYWRDNRLNMIHEGTHGIQAQDLLGRKVRAEGGRALALWQARLQDTARRARAVVALQPMADALEDAAALVTAATQAAWRGDRPDVATHNAMGYLRGFGHTVVAWLWLDLATLASQRLEAGAGDAQLLQGQLAAARYFFVRELPQVGAWLAPVIDGDDQLATLDTDVL
ncbi:acyl-CoA dehydrogenase [Hydrogenophaga electricum]|uniref:Acyl-CoA dehydrogenase n=1 Tax=Hydrogenophaga electricum TaxID=1230953 RepID=A0ABQ6C9C7_9BURK|nr:acyl-CoA dehydrogenase [Hydrogenophaga electricum]GLS15385.1 acyl-CoA dehydrogenase [Hydrogenophaga electricum]